MDSLVPGAEGRAGAGAVNEIFSIKHNLPQAHLQLNSSRAPSPGTARTAHEAKPLWPLDSSWLRPSWVCMRLVRGVVRMIVFRQSSQRRRSARWNERHKRVKERSMRPAEQSSLLRVLFAWCAGGRRVRFRLYPYTIRRMKH
jgi:hypothetical protein